jgi:hypothetical protein
MLSLLRFLKDLLSIIYSILSSIPLNQILTSQSYFYIKAYYLDPFRDLIYLYCIFTTLYTLIKLLFNLIKWCLLRPLSSIYQNIGIINLTYAGLLILYLLVIVNLIVT